MFYCKCYSIQKLIENNLKKYDTEKMYKVYNEWPEIAKKSFELDIQEIKFQNIDHIVFAGMGGSGTAITR